MGVVYQIAGVKTIVSLIFDVSCVKKYPKREKCELDFCTADNITALWSGQGEETTLPTVEQLKVSLQ